MPLICNNPEGEDFRLLVWRLEETTDTLRKFLPAKISSALEIEYPHPQRFRQKLVVTILLEKLGLTDDPEVTYLPSGKPLPKNFDGFISISHSRMHVGILYHPHQSCGLDLEEPGERLRRLAVRFLNSKEEEWIRPSEQLQDLCLVWSAKEAVFKAIGGGGIVFREHLSVQAPQHMENGIGQTEVLFHKPGHHKKFQVRFRHLDSVLLVHTIA